MMRRGLIVISVFLLLGAILNLIISAALVALAADANDFVDERDEPASDDLRRLIPAHDEQRFRRFGWGDASSDRRHSGWFLAPGMAHRAHFVYVTNTVLLEAGDQVLAGWPRLSLFGERWNVNPDTRQPATCIAAVSFTVPWSKYSNDPSMRRLMPLRPIWPGFVINAVFYSAILWLLLVGPRKVRRLVRAKRGRCLACNYNLRGTAHERCPECGTVARAAQQTSAVIAPKTPPE
jgi:hypothetical protein